MKCLLALATVLAAGTETAQAPQPTATTASDPALSRNLREAYQREFVFLAEQKRELKRRVQAFKRRSAAQQAQLTDAVGTLESSLLAREAEALKLQDMLTTLEREAQSAEDAVQLIESVEDQARTTLGANGIEIPELNELDASNEEARLTALFDRAGALLRKLGSIQSHDGTFFLESGEKVAGTVINVGDVAAYGLSPQGSGVLAPAGGGALKLWDAPASATTRALAEGEKPSTLPVFLYESLERKVEADTGMSMWAHVASGGSIAWVIVALGAVGLVFIALRTVQLRTASTRFDVIEEKIGHLVREGKLEEAEAVARDLQGAAARVVAVVLNRVTHERQKLEDALSEALLAEDERLNRFGTVILVIAAVAPLLGLLGTVTGMIATFDVITQFGTGDPKMLSGGISTALVTTELGLIVAIPTLFLGSLLSGWAERVKDDVERAALRVLNIHSDGTSAEPPRSTPTPRDDGGSAPAVDDPRVRIQESYAKVRA